MNAEELEKSRQEGLRRVFNNSNYTQPLNSHQLMLECGFSKLLSEYRQKDVLKKHEDVLRSYVLSFTVGEHRESPKHGLIMNGDTDLCHIYMSVVLQRVFVRRRTIYCGSVLSLENECRDFDQLKFISDIDLLGVYHFPYFTNGLPEGKDHLLMTPFHHMLLRRIDNGVPTLFVTPYSIEEVLNRYDRFPRYMVDALENSNKIFTFESGTNE